MTKKNTFEQFLFSLLIGAAVVIIALAEPTAYYFGAVIIGFIGIAWSSSCACIAAAPCIFGIVMTTMGELTYMLSSIALLLLTAIILIVGFKKRIPYRMLAVLLAIVVLVTLYIELCLPDIVRGEAPYASLREYFLTANELLKSEAGISENTYFVDLAENIDVLLYPMFIVISEALAFIGVVMCKKLCTWAKADVRPMAKLVDWEIPSSMRIGVPVFAVGCLIIYLTGYRGIDQIVASIVGLVAPILYIEGIASITFLIASPISLNLSAAPRKNGVIYALIILIALLLPLPFVIMGVIELYWQHRPKIRVINEKIRKAVKNAELKHLDVVQVDLDDGRGLRIIATRKRKVGDEAFFDEDIRKAVRNGQPIDVEQTDQDEGNKSTNDDNNFTDNDKNTTDNKKNAADNDKTAADAQINPEAALNHLYDEDKKEEDK